MKLRKLCALALAGLLTLSALVGCTSAKTVVGGDTSSTASSVGDTEFATLADYLADPDVKASIDAEIEAQTDDSMTIKVYADDNALVYEYQFTDEYDLSDEAEKQSVQDALKEGCEENASTFEDIADTIESEVGLSGVHVRLVYLNGDGSEIYTHDFE